MTLARTVECEEWNEEESERSDIETVLNYARQSLLLAGLPMAVRYLWVELMLAMLRCGVSVLRFGSVAVPRSELVWIFNVSVSDLNGYLQPLLDRGLLELEPDGAIAAPQLLKLLGRSI